ncbi:MAG: hypothetical protein HKO59_11675 [Phycisphaerales bacterium]|nr:hypothetical protein [Phycisphaerae bacterium]NNF44854.1 hypothetical protein [Phycisphaerales bacterium]NNM26622.1 hypothetical protein [Phycisphaerales bacterium]
MPIRICMMVFVGWAWLAAPADAAFSHARLEVVAVADGLTTFHYIAVFDHPEDALLEVGGIPGVRPFEFEADASLFNDAGAFEGLSLGDFPNIGNPRDSWLTIGDTRFPAAVAYTEGFGGVPTATQAFEGCCVFESNGLWFDTDPKRPVTGVPIAPCRFEVLIAQITLPNGVDFSMTGALRYRDGIDGVIRRTGFEVPLTPPGTCPGDVDCSGQVGFTDLVMLLATWGPCDGICVADLDDDGVVGFSDLLTLLASWGPCP